MTDELAETEDETTAATTKRKDKGTDDTQVSGIAYGPDSAIAVNAADFHALLEHARKTGGEALAAKYPNL
jgi:hypothetical protein